MKLIKYFFEFIIIIIFFFIFKIIRYKNATDLGEIIGKIFGPLVCSNEKILKNLENSKVGNSDNDRKMIIKKMWGNYGRIFAEYIYLKNFRENNLSSNVKIFGKEILEKIKKK